MKILLCHNHYQQRGGEDESFEDEARLLQARGHSIVRFTIHNEVIGDMGRIAVAARTLWNRGVYRQLRALIREQRPQVVHCTNTFPLISPSAYYAAHAEGLAVVQSLRNYRLLCANALFLREGRACEDCRGRCGPLHALAHRCYRNSLSATAVLTGMTALHRLAGTWKRAVDLYFTPSEFARRKFVDAGFPAERIAVKPNFVFPDPLPGAGAKGGAIFVGRLSHEKGIETVLDAWLEHGLAMPLTIIGDGPLADRVRDACTKCDRITWLGRRPLEEALEIIGEAAVLICPSIAYETFGRTVVEAFAKGTPVLCSDAGAAAELVTPGKTGMLFRTGDPSDLAANMRALAGEPGRLAAMREPARLEYRAKYDADTNHEILMDINQRAIARRGGGAGVPLPVLESGAKDAMERANDKGRAFAPPLS